MKQEILLDRYFRELEKKGSSPYTLKAYKLDLQDFLKHLKNHAQPKLNKTENIYNLFIEASNRELESYVKYIEYSSASTICRKLGTIKRFLIWALKEGLRKSDIPKKPITPPLQVYIKSSLSNNELNMLLRLVERLKQKRNEVIVKLLIYTGIRVSELIGLKWKDIEITRYEGFLRLYKKNNERIIPLNNSIRIALIEFKKSRSDEYLLYGKRGKLTEDGVLRVFYSLNKYLKFKITPNNLRHTFCNLLSENGVGVEKISYITGISTASCLKKFAKPSLKELEKVLFQLDN